MKYQADNSGAGPCALVVAGELYCAANAGTEIWKAGMRKAKMEIRKAGMKAKMEIDGPKCGGSWDENVEITAHRR